MSRAALAVALAAWLAVPALAQEPPEKALADPGAFERGFAVSLYRLDGCGDQLAGRMFRRALAERFAGCPFTPEARARFQQRTRAEQARARRIMDGLVESHGGLPSRLEGMATTCHQQAVSGEYREFRAKLERYAAGGIPAEAIVPSACDAIDVAP